MVSKTFAILGFLALIGLAIQPVQASEKAAKKGRSPSSISPGSSVAVPDPLDLSRIKPGWFTSAKMPESRSMLANPAKAPVLVGAKYGLDESGLSVLSPRRNPYATGYFWLP